MKSKYFQTLLLVGILPLLVLAGVHLLLGTGQTAPQAPTGGAPSTSVAAMQSQVKTVASSMYSDVIKVYNEAPGISAHHADADLDAFLNSHPGLTGVALVSNDGKTVKNFPAGTQLVDAAYGSTDEFQKTLVRLQEKNGKTYQFYTQRLGNPSFVFAVTADAQNVAEAVMDLGAFFKGLNLAGGEACIVDAGSGNFFYHSNASKMATTFNPGQEAWLTKVLTDLSNGQEGSSIAPSGGAAVYVPLGIAKFGIVFTVPASALQASGKPPSSSGGLMDRVMSPLFLAILALLAWVAGFGTFSFKWVLSPVARAGSAVLAAAEGKGELTPEVVKSFGNDEAGRMVQASAQLIDKLEGEKRKINSEKEDFLRQAKAQIEQKAKEAETQAADAQRARGELSDKNSQLADKLKEIEAMKGMAEGLRNQVEQTKVDNGKLKGQISASEQTQAALNQNFNRAQAQLKEMEGKLLAAIASASAIQVSKVRAAAIRTMAEELKTTLGIIKGYVSSALGASQGGINEKQQEFLGMVINRSARLEKFINDLLDIYQVEIEQTEVKTEEVNLAAEIEGLAFNFQAQAEVKNVKIKVEAKPNLPKVPIVRRRFNQLWNILYLQLIKDAPRGAVIPITVESIGETMKVVLQDPGLMVQPESLPRLFDEFYDPKHPASPQLAGTGLKFALVKTILAAHGGGAVAEKGDPGTRMTLTFSTRARKPGEAAGPAIGSVIPKVAASPSVTAPSINAPKPAVAPIGAPKPAASIPGLTAKPAAPSAPLAPPSPVPAAPKPMAPPTQAPSAPKPAAPSAPGEGTKPAAVPGFLDSLISKKAADAVPSAAPAMPAKPAPPPVKAETPMGVPTSPSLSAPPRPPMPAAPKAPIPLDGLQALFDAKPAPPPIPSSSGTSIPAVPPSPTVPVSPSPAMPIKPTPPSITVPPSPPLGQGAVKIVQTSLKPSAPSSGMMDLDSLDSFKVEAPQPMKPSAPLPGGLSFGEAKPTLIPPTGEKPFLKDMNKEGDGEILE